MTQLKFKGKFQEASNKHRGRCYPDMLRQYCAEKLEKLEQRKPPVHENKLTMRQVWTCPLTGIDHYWPHDKAEPEPTFTKCVRFAFTGEITIPKDEE
jgi:hypothetical protein